ncbi:hypothetical protein GCM10010532_044150 [Dactylosporangium siamense]|uniref:Uncharacterized protein n=1 Tax=Dactylosporangium siamense TaxID=685454 RepID=A0A919PK54_9ACTN|nr:hypothetical protein Dsi01nite_032700 [Dactylosporangium siamense]
MHRVVLTTSTELHQTSAAGGPDSAAHGMGELVPAGITAGRPDDAGRLRDPAGQPRSTCSPASNAARFRTTTRFAIKAPTDTI